MTGWDGRDLGAGRGRQGEEEQGSHEGGPTTGGALAGPDSGGPLELQIRGSTSKVAYFEIFREMCYNIPEHYMINKAQYT